LQKNLLDFTDFSSFYTRYEPLTPYGRQRKTAFPFFTRKAPLEREYDLVGSAMEFIEKDPAGADRIEYHLRRIPELPPPDASDLNSTDLFQIKKFLLNYREIAGRLPGDLKKMIGLRFSSERLLKLLSPDDGGSESFSISSSYSPELTRIREDIRDMDRKLADCRRIRLEAVQRETGFDFSGADFLVVRETEAARRGGGFIFIEPYDSSYVVIKPVLGPDYFELHSGREELLLAERGGEAEVLKLLSASVRQQQDLLERYVKWVTEADTALAKGRLALRFSLVRPRLCGAGQSVSVRGGRYISMERKARELGTPYQPVNADFDGRIIVVTGSNMGGKTVLLKSLLFFQILAQSGFFVPAEAYETVLFDHFLLMGENDENGRTGLSSFGLEIYKLTSSESGGRTLYIVDEFARTTNAVEGKALLAAILKRFSEKDAYAFFSTHFSGLPPMDGVSLWRMKGLNYAEYKKYYHMDFNCDLDERIRLINSFMEYQVIPDRGDSRCRDALKIADILGLDSSIIQYAREFLESEKEL